MTLILPWDLFRVTFQYVFLFRQEEKESLQNLNNRLAAYIDRIRHLEMENAKLSHQVKL